MPHIKFFKDITKNDVAEAGGKGASLGELTRTGIPVPPGFVILADAFNRFLEETDLYVEIAARLKEVNPADTNSVERASVVIRDAIHDQAMPEDLEKEILEAFDELFDLRKRINAPGPYDLAQGRPERQPRGGGSHPPTPLTGGNYVAVRSSATAEDSAIASWAGELETYLNTTRENVLERVKLCWSSLFTPRAIFYRHEKNLIDAHVAVAVVVQKMVQSEISGIVFTVHPVTEDYDQMIIEAGFGLGEAIVSGQITPDSYVVNKEEMNILDINVASQSRKLVRRTEIKKKGNKEIVDTENPSNEWVELSEADGGKQKLGGKQIIELAEICKGIEKHYGFPCDIEWAYEEGKFYVTQSRPITTLKANGNVAA